MAPKRIFYLDILASEIRSVRTDGTDDGLFLKIPVLTEASGNQRSVKTHLPDGIQYDSKRKRFYWTMMGSPAAAPNGHLMSCARDGSDMQVLVPPNGLLTRTPKQLVYNSEKDTIFWCDREGGSIHSVKPDGSSFTTLYTSHPDEQVRKTDERYWPVGIAIDASRRLVYWTQKGPPKGNQGRIFRAAVREHTLQDIQILFDNLPEPIDLELDVVSQRLYWTDRGDVPYGNTLNHVDVSAPLKPSETPTFTFDPKEHILAHHFHEAIGLAFESVEGGAKKVFYVSDLLGTLWRVDQQGETTALFRDRGNITGICLVDE